MDSQPTNIVDAAKCPLCGEPNDCQLCTVSAYKGPCWCFKTKIPEELIARVPEESQNKACVCRDCVMKFNREKAASKAASPILPGDFYFEKGLMVLKAAFHLRRGYCAAAAVAIVLIEPTAYAVTASPWMIQS